MKVLLTLLDGMRPDALTACGSEFANELLQNTGTYTLTATTVMPSVTLPCHMSLFHSVPPERHGIVTNNIHSAGTSRSGNMRTCACGRKKSSSVL